ncbi:bacteriocin immunity protein [Vagococcus elongatus]|uniref:Bacteriocin immunity protein n=1 Tax=Vagococcus elongatus TaxID=180344 RepID=A0A430APN1_9ENTE|nr:bacteriocin immunity protein [Vagococcus elongatus]RSU09847.1 bacteriocin immunity protein [Vagococcus elongatus]
MKHVNKADEMFKNISTAYSDEQIKKIPELQKILLMYGAELEKTGDFKLVAAKLCRAIEQESLYKHFDLPKALMTLYHQLKPEARKYEAVMVSAMMTPFWL